MNKNFFSLTEAADLLGIKRRTLAFYADSEFVSPAILSSTGRGTKRLFSRDNLFEFMLIKELNEKGVRLEFMQVILHIFKNMLDNLEKRPSYLIIFNPNSSVDFQITAIPDSDYHSDTINLKLKTDKGNFFSAALIFNLREMWDRLNRKL